MGLCVIIVCISYAHTHVHVSMQTRLQKHLYLRWYSNPAEFNSQMPQTGTTNFCIHFAFFFSCV